MKSMAKANVFSEITLAGRRIKEGVENPIFTQKVVDFENLAEDVFAGHSQVFCVLGTTRGKAGADGFVKVDKDYVENVASISQKGFFQFSTGHNIQTVFP